MNQSRNNGLFVSLLVAAAYAEGDNGEFLADLCVRLPFRWAEEPDDGVLALLPGLYNDE